ncbi:MAG TPA: hypothetical protein VLI39_09355 [Sedimentisphaerales bacterium]|nr:hypothetical protein [Sedimentisphaerales bacterium]
MTQEIRTNTTQTEGPSSGSYSDWLAGYRSRLGDDLARFRRFETRWSWLRLIAFVAGFAAAILLRHNLAIVAAAGSLGVLAFVVAVQKHLAWANQRAMAERASTVASESFHASTRRDSPARAWQRPEDLPDASAVVPPAIDCGPAWPLTDQERDDLDLYGPPVGIFGLLNRTSTVLGALRLRDMLDSPCLSPEQIRNRQDAVRWLAQRNELRMEMMAAITRLRGHDKLLDRLVRLVHRTDYPARSRLSAGLRLWSAAAGLLVLYAVLQIANGQIQWARILVALLLANSILLVAARPLFRRLDAVVSDWAILRNTLGCLLEIARRAGRDLPDQTQLSLLKNRFADIASNAHIPSLCGWLDWAGMHGMMRAVLNALVFFDFHVAEAAIARIVPNRSILLQGLSALAELEAMCSLASFSAELPVACYPEPDAERTLHIEDGRHPLIPAPDAVPNSIHLTRDLRTWVVTGPNAAGKSTFVRMVGVNVLLAQIGAAVPAQEMRGSPIRLITDVRIRDDLALHESYFLSEVRRLRRLVLDAESGTPLLGLIDEPFRGTNSQERAAAGVALLEHLMASSNLFVIATHEEVLAQTAARVPTAANCHFQERLHDGGIEFDYLLRPGPAGTKTAIRILEREGYPPSLLQRARNLVTKDTPTARSD